MRELNKDNYFLSGAVESALVFYDTATIGAAKSVNEEAVILQENSLCRFYIGKEGITRAKDELLGMPISKVAKDFEDWRQKWERMDGLFFGFATNISVDWKSDWKKLNQVTEEFWLESYRVECLDPFASEFEQTLKLRLEKTGIEAEHLYDLIAPLSPTVIQQAVLDLEILNKSDYLRKYWFSLGSWKGGEILEKKHLKNFHKEILPNFEARKRFQKSINSKFDGETLNLIELLRLFTLWREERKTFLQRIILSYQNILRFAAKQLKVSYDTLLWARLDEVLEAQDNLKMFEERRRRSVYFLGRGKDKADILIGMEAGEIINSFLAKERVREIKGTVASWGKVTGLVKRILKEHHFDRFNEGDILVTTMTRPEYVPLMKKASAIITDEGGLTSHAAIVARELKKPCIIGTKNATQILEDGDRIEVDANQGIIRTLD